MQGFHIPAAPPLYTNTFLLISDAGHAVVIDPAAEVHSYDEILKQHNATLTTILCTHGHYDHVGSAAALKAEWNATLYCEKADLAGDRMYPLSTADCGYTEGEQIAVDELHFTAWHTPGHTPGSVVLLCGEHLFCGDTLFAGSIGRTDLEGGSSAQMADSLRKLAQLPSPAKHRCCPATANFLPWRGAGQQLLYPQRPARRQRHFLKRERHEDLYHWAALRVRGGASCPPVLPHGTLDPDPAGAC